MINKLEFLKDYNSDIIIITDNISNTTIDIPSKWYKVFIKKQMKDRVIGTLKIWDEFVSKELSLTVDYMKKNLISVELIKYKNKIAVLYGIKRKNSEQILYYEGLLKIDYGNNFLLENNWDKFPISIQNFYLNIHNGFYYYPSHSMGLLALEEVLYFEDYDWGILDELEAPIGINLETTYGFFSSGGGGYLAIDISKSKKEMATIWYDDCEPDYNVDFWDYLDEWILIGFQS